MEDKLLVESGNNLAIMQQHPIRGAPDSDFYYQAGFAGYLKKIRPDTGYFINLNT
jgi:hypothetical protein